MKKQIAMRLAALFFGSVMVLAQTSCGGDRAVNSTPAATTSEVQLYNTASNTTVVTLPQGSSLTPNKLTVVDAVTQATPSANGSVTISAYADAGSQLAVVMSPNGNPMLLGWLDANHATIDASTTAEVLAYFALGGELLLANSDRSEMIAEIPGAGGFQSLVQVISDQITANPDAFATDNVALSSAVTAFFAAASGGTAAPAAIRQSIADMAHARPAAVNITPDVQSGVTVIQDPPFAVHLVNNYRRRSYAYVERVSHTVGFGAAAVETPDPAAVTDFEVAPVIGLTGGVNGTISDIVNAYFGLQNTAYGPVSSPSTGSVSTPLLAGTDKTTYKITVVGPGAPNDAAIAALTAAQNDKRIRISVIGFCNDVIIPFFGNVIFGSSLFPGSGRQPTATLTAFKAAFINNLENDIFLALPTLGTLQDKIVSGHYADAAADIANNGLTGNAVQGLVEKAIQESYVALALSGPASAFGPNGPSPVSVAMTGITRILGVAGAALQVFDTAVYTAQGTGSDAVNTWTLSAIKQVVSLSPATSNIDVGGVISLTANVQGVEDPTTTFSYQWTTTTVIGDLTEVGGSMRRGQTTYCSSSNVANFVYEHQAALGATDTVTVQAFSTPNCDATTLLGSGTSTMTFAPAANTVTVTPGLTQASPSQVIGLNAALGSSIIDPDAVVNYQWSVTGSAAGTLTDPATGAPSTSYSSSSASATYSASAAAKDGQQDTIQVTVVVTSKTNPAISITVATGKATVEFSPVDVSGWLGAWTCPGTPETDTLTFLGSPYTGAPDNLNDAPAGANLLVLITNDQNLGEIAYWLTATSTSAIDARAASNPTVYTFALTRDGGTISGYYLGPCSK